MSKKKLGMMAWAVAVALAFMPFLHGCTKGAAQNTAQPGSDQQNTDTRTEVVRYGQVMTVNGAEVIVVVSEL
ncbi:hypothetical protein [Gordonibacter sp.]|uniref:hypothetical protein n=1 Tax=Gordonibacter sp. TaxID=1968902 RepID=UPI002FCBA6D1